MIDQTTFFEKIAEVCSHPKLYTSTGSFDEVTVFLEKYGKSIIVGEFYYHSVFTPFLNWFVKKNDIQEKAVSLKRFRENFSSDDEALDNLHSLYREYVRTLI